MEEEEYHSGYALYGNEPRTEEVQEIIKAVPSWIIRWGITIVFAVLAGIILASSLIQYPDVVKTPLKINSLNAPKTVLARQSGKLTALLAKEGDQVENGQALAYLESTGNPDHIQQLDMVLKRMQDDLFRHKTVITSLPENLNLGELQNAYQNFYQVFLEFQSTQQNGFYLSKRNFLNKELENIRVLRLQVKKQEEVQKLEFKNAEAEYLAYQKLYNKKVISRSEFALQENKYLASKYPMQQSETALLTNDAAYQQKEKELMELEHTIAEQQSKFMQALNQCLTEIDGWIQIHILKASVKGKLSYAGIIQQNQNVANNQEIFIINPGNADFFGEVEIPQYNMGKIRTGERVLVKLHSYPFEQYGLIRGQLSYISEVALRDSVFVGKIKFDHFENKEHNRKIILKNGMRADAEIVTEESSLLKRFTRGIVKILDNRD